MSKKDITIRNLIIDYQNIPSDLTYDLDNLHSNLEAIACNNEETYIIVDHKTKSYTYYNYNKNLYHLVGSEFNRIDKNLYYLSMHEDLSFLLKKYIEIANSHFTDKIETDKCYFFKISFGYGTYGGKKGLSIKLVPIIFTPCKKLYVTLCIMNLNNHVGKAILEKYMVREDRILIYDHNIKQFVDKEDVQFNNDELQILILSGKGKTEKEISQILCLPLSKIKQYKSDIFNKLKVKTISEAIYIAYKRELMK
ncbi:MAG: response regulator transcription factor [Bacteroidales bacterium]